MTPTQYALSIYDTFPAGVGALAFIGGGCFRSLYDGTPVKDIDLFFRSYQDYAQACALFSLSNTYTEAPSESAGNRVFRHVHGVNPPVNLIGFRFHRTLHALVHDFDFTCITCGAEMVTPGVVEIVEGSDFVCDASHKYLRFNKVQNYERAYRRIARYESYGYTRTFGVAASLIRARFIPAPARGGDY